MTENRERENELYRFQNDLRSTADKSAEIATSLLKTTFHYPYTQFGRICIDLYNKLEREYNFFPTELPPPELRRAYETIELEMTDVGDYYSRITRRSASLDSFIATRKYFGTRSPATLRKEITQLGINYNALKSFSDAHKTGEMTPARAVHNIRHAITSPFST